MREGNTSEPYRERVYEAFADEGLSFDEAVETALRAGMENLDLSVGLVTNVGENEQIIEYALDDDGELRPGDTCPTSEAYCQRTVELESVLSIQNARASAEVTDAAVERFGLETYIGSKVTVGGETYGSVCFADRERRAEPFTEAEELFVELVARLVGFGLERVEHRRRREERTDRLAAEKRRLERIAETSFDIIFRVSADGQFTYVSPAVERVLGYTPAALTGEPFADYLTADSRSDAMAAFESVIEGGTVTGLELTFEGRSGEQAILEVNAVPVDEADVAVQGVGRDVTERKEQEAALRARTRAMDAAAVPITIAEAREGPPVVVYANDAFERVTGFKADEIRGENYRRLLGPETDASDVDAVETAIEAERPVTTELLNYRRDGTPFWNRLTITPIEDADGETSHFIGFHQDVTERVRTERLVDLLNRVLRHNLRNELTVIQGCADLVDTRQEAGADIEGPLRRTIQRLSSLSSQAHELETYAKQPRTPVELDLGTMLRSVADDHRAQYPEATISVAVETERAVSAGRELERAIAELVTNALEHGPARTTVDLVARDDGQTVEVTVADDGDGISPLEAAVVEAGRETPLEHGRGLGLWLVNWIVTRYGGSFQIRPDDGTVATLRLPAIGPGQSVDDAVCRPTTLFR
ncbi:PAS domain S-box protein [Halomicroarcula sp. GCM10025817]|uniref:PAS domain S-box protein n=1 Tax=Haloarcula TaxID=2237 RepID=UPI0023E863D3|nr:PAS domain S-box protein [Halomicroarcula sp. SYNS111]